MAVTITPTQDNIQDAIGAVLKAILPAGIETIAGQVNRVPEPSAADFVVMTPVMRTRISTNVDTYIDNVALGSISGTDMTLSSVIRGSFKPGDYLFGIGLSNNTQIVSGSGGAGAYVITPSQTVAGPTKIAAGQARLLQATKVTYQLDVHGPNGAENAQIISTIFRDRIGVKLFVETGFDIQPLQADDPHQMPFTNGEQQYEDRWVVTAVLQVNEVVTSQVPGAQTQFADELNIGIINVDAEYPP